MMIINDIELYSFIDFFLFDHWLQYFVVVFVQRTTVYTKLMIFDFNGMKFSMEKNGRIRNKDNDNNSTNEVKKYRQ